MEIFSILLTCKLMQLCVRDEIEMRMCATLYFDAVVQSPR